MSFLRRLFSKPATEEPDAAEQSHTAERRERAAGPITDWSDANMDELVHRVAMMDPSPHILRVVGVTQYQGTLEHIAGARTVDGASFRDHWGLFIPEPHNVYDSAAVRVILSQQVDRPRSGHVGYLSRDDAVAYRPVIDRLAAGGLILAGRASIEGGWERYGQLGTFGVRLHVSTPVELMREIDESPFSSLVPPAPPDWEAQSAPAFEKLLATLEPTTGEHAGKTVCFTGPSVCRVGGRELSRADQERLAEHVGLKTHPRLTKTVDLLVLSNARADTGKARKAQEYGTRVIGERHFWQSVGVPVD